MTILDIPFNNPATYPGHSGVDYGQPEFTPFRASDSGEVISHGSNARGGHYIWVKYDSIQPLVGYHHMPGHKWSPRPGSRFSYADQLGLVGNTGNSTGPHLHSEVQGYATTAGYWQWFNPNSVVSEKQIETDEEMTISYINIQGEAGKRRGGCYAVMRDNGGKLFARFVSPTPHKDAPTIQSGRALNEFQASIPGLA